MISLPAYISLKALVYDILPSTTAVFSYAIGSRKLSANQQFCCCWCSNSSKFVTNNSNYIRRLFYEKIVCIEMELFSFFKICGGCVSCLYECLGARLLPQSYQYPKLAEGSDRICGQLCRDKECPFSDITKSGRVWREMPENSA